MLRVLTVVLGLFIWFGCKDDDKKSTTPPPGKEDPEEPQLKVNFVTAYTAKVKSGLIEVQWTSILKKDFIRDEETYSFFHLDFQSQKVETETLGDGDLWGWIGCFDGVTDCREFDSIGAVVEHEKAGLVAARGLDPAIYTEAKFIEQQDDVTIDGKVFAVVDFEIKKQDKVRFDRLFYHLVDTTNLVVLRIETEFQLGELWPQIKEAIDSTVDSIKITVGEEGEDPELQVDFVTAYTDKISTGDIEVEWTSIIKKGDVKTEETFTSFHLPFQSQKINTETLGDGDLWGMVGCLSDCPVFESLNAVIELEKTNLVVARGLDPAVYTEAKFIARHADMTINGNVFAVVDFEIKKQGKTQFDRLCYFLVDGKNLVVMRVETEFQLNELWPQIKEAIDSTMASIKVTVTEGE